MSHRHQRLPATTPALRLLLVVVVLALGGCASLSPSPSGEASDGGEQATDADEQDADEPGEAEPTEDESSASAPEQAPEDAAEAAAEEAEQRRRRGRLSGENLYRLLVADLAGRQGDLGLALEGYLEAARDTRDPRIAERATRLGFYAERFDAAHEAAQRWVELAPRSQAAHAALARLQLRRDEPEAAERTLVRVIELGGEGPQSGWSKAGSILTESERTATALATAEALVERFREQATSHYVVARLAADAGDTERALDALDQALARRTLYPDALLLRARLLSEQDRVDEALAGLRGAYRQAPDNQDIALGYVRMLVETGRIDTARSEMERAHERFGDDPDAVYTLGLLAMEAELWSDARLYLERLVQMDARRSKAHYYLGRIAQQQGECERALQHYVKVGDGEHRFDAELRAGVCMARVGRLEEARLHLQRMQSRFDEEAAITQIVLTAARVERQADQPERALEALNNALERFPQNQDLLYARALAAVELDRVDRARRDLESILERDPNNARALNALGYTLANRKLDLERAQRLIERALEQDPEDAATLDSMGWVLYRRGRNERALQYLQRAWEQQKDPEIAAHLGEVLWSLGRREQARRIWSQGREHGDDQEVLDETVERLTQ